MNENVILIVALVPALVFAIVFHEVAHGYVAKLLGDPTAQERKRLTLNPIRHVDPVGTLILPGFLAFIGAPVFGWAKPVPVNAGRLRNPRYGMMAVAAAGPGMNLVLAGLGAVALGTMARFVDADSGLATALLGTSLNYFILVNVFLALFNLLPIPPFDGSHIVEGLLPDRAAMAYARLRPLGLPLVFLLLLVLPSLIPGFDIVDRFVLPPVDWVQDQYFRLAGWFAGG